MNDPDQINQETPDADPVLSIIPLGGVGEIGRNMTAYEFGGKGGQIQNSNSVAFTLGKAMGLDLSRALRDKGMMRTFSGWDRDLLDPKYQRYVAPPMFSVTNAP